MKTQFHLLILTFLTFIFLSIQPAKAQFPTDTVDFSFPDSIPELVADSTTGDWQIGTPQKAFFGDAPSQPYAIMTDTLHPFSPDTTSSFVLKFANGNSEEEFNYTEKICFDHKLEASTDSDFAQVALSADHGLNWYDFTNDQGGYMLTEGNGDINYSDDFYTDWHSINNDSLYGFTGVTQDYRRTCLNICWFIPIFHEGNTRSVPPDSLWVKFTFIAGSNTAQNAGWIIDNVIFDYYYCGSGVAEHNLPPLELYPQPAQSILHFYKPENTSSQAVLKIFDAMGKCIANVAYQNESLSIDTQSWASGLYTYILTDKEIPVNVGKIIISH